MNYATANRLMAGEHGIENPATVEAFAFRKGVLATERYYGIDKDNAVDRPAAREAMRTVLLRHSIKPTAELEFELMFAMLGVFGLQEADRLRERLNAATEERRVSDINCAESDAEVRALRQQLAEEKAACTTTPGVDIRQDREGVYLWHINCVHGHSIMRVVSETEDSAMLECEACQVRGLYPYGGAIKPATLPKPEKGMPPTPFLFEAFLNNHPGPDL